MSTMRRMQNAVADELIQKIDEKCFERTADLSFQKILACFRRFLAHFFIKFYLKSQAILCPVGAWLKSQAAEVLEGGIQRLRHVLQFRWKISKVTRFT